MGKKIKRDNIYVGRLAKLDRRVIRFVIGSDGEECKIVDNYWKRCRTILFTIDEDKKAHDLLYDTEVCPIDRITPKDNCKVIEGSPIVFDALSMKPLLEYFRFSEYMSSNEIAGIKKKFFSPQFFRENCHLFGYKELGTADMMSSGGFSVDDEIARVIYENHYQMLIDNGLEQYEFVAEEQPALPIDYFEKLRTLAGIGSRYYDVGPKDSFKPKLLKEGHVKKLIRKVR